MLSLTHQALNDLVNFSLVDTFVIIFNFLDFRLADFLISAMNGKVDNHAVSLPRKIPPPVRTISWSENVSQEDLDVPGTPRTPRTSTTPGKFALLFIVNASFSSLNQCHPTGQ